jgi:hypothetical protein
VTRCVSAGRDAGDAANAAGRRAGWRQSASAVYRCVAGGRGDNRGRVNPGRNIRRRLIRRRWRRVLDSYTTAIVTVPAVVEMVVAAAWMDSVAMRRLRRGGLDPVMAKGNQGEHCNRNACTEEKRQVRAHVAAAPP